MTRRAKQQLTVRPLPTGTEGIREFLERELPPGKRAQAPYLTNVLLEAGRLYDRRTARRDKWLNYTARADRLRQIKKRAEELASGLSGLDILSHDDLAAQFGPKEIEELIGTLHILGKELETLRKTIQQAGRPRELAEERWIMEVADIYENAFGRPARVWGSGSGPTTARGSFYRLLEISRPTSFASAGKLSPRQVERKLKGRRKTATSPNQYIAEQERKQLREARSIKADINKMNTKELRKLVTAMTKHFTQLPQTKKETDDPRVILTKHENVDPVRDDEVR